MPFSSTFEPPGSPFLLPFLLASSWAWLALSLATIATLLRALPIFDLASFRLRRSTRSCGLPPPIALATSADCIPASSSCLAELQVDHSSPLAFEPTQAPPKALALSGQKSAVRRKSRSKSTSALQKLILQHHKHTGVLRSSMGLLSCLLDTEIAFTLEKIPNPNSSFKTFNDDLIPQLDSVDAKVSAGRRCRVSIESQKHGIMLEQRSQGVEDGSVCDVVTDSSSKSCFRGEPPHLEENLSRCGKLPAWAFSLLKSVQAVTSSARCPSNLCHLERIPSFEKQFGWDRMLVTRLGWSWEFAGNTIGWSAEPQQSRHEREVVKVWSAQQKTLLKKLKVAESTTSALAAGWRNKSACVGTKMGEISLWDVREGICVNRIRPFQTPVCALFIDSAKEMTFVGTTGGGDMALGLWDHRSLYEPMFHWERTPAAHIPMACLKVDGYDLSVSGAGAVSMHDLRKPNKVSIASFRVDLASEFCAADAPAMVTEEDPAFVWETEAALAGEEDDEYGDDCGQTEMPEAVSSKHSGGSSFVSRCVGLIRSMSSPSAQQRSERIGD